MFLLNETASITNLWRKNFNTSHVSIKLVGDADIREAVYHFNTSHVSIKRTRYGFK